MQASLTARFLALCLLACAARAFAASAPAILYVNSYHPGYSWSDALQGSLLGVLRDSLGESDSIRAEYLDAKRYGPGLKGELGEMLERAWEKKYAGMRFSLLLVSDQDGYDFLRRVRARLFPGVPLVFVGVEEPVPLDPATTGILSTTNLEANIGLIRQVMPGTRRIWVITDPSRTGRLNQAHMAALAKHLAPRLELRFFHNGEGMDEDSLLRQVEDIPVSEPLFFLDYAVDASGRSVPVLPFLKRLSARSRAPVFSHVDLYMQGGVAGGYMKSGEQQGRQLALLGLDVLRGRVQPNENPRPEQGKPYVDKSRLHALGIDVQNLPGSDGLHSDLKDLWERFAPYMVLLSVFLVLQTLTIGWLLLLYRRQRHLREVAADEERLFRTVFELAPFPCVLNRLDGTYMNVNQAFLENTGHTREEVIGKTAVQLLEAENGDAEDVNLYREDAQKRMEVLREKGVLLNEPLRFGKRDTRDRYYSSRLIDYKNTPCVLTIILDLTELQQTRNRLRQSEEKFQRIVESMPMAVGVANAQGQIVYVNCAFNRLFGYTLEDIPDMESWTRRAYPDEAYRAKCLAQWKADIDAADKDPGHASPVHTYRIADKMGHLLEIDITFTLVEGDVYAMFDDVTFQKKAERELHEGIRRAKAQRVALAQLTLGPEGASLHLEELYKTTVQVVSQSLQVARASVWLMDSEDKLLVCQALYNAQNQSLESGSVLDPSTFPEYFQALKGTNHLFVEDAQNDPRSAELADNYLKPLHIVSMLDAAILVEGKLMGVICCEHMGTPRHWHSDEESFIGHISAFLSQQLINQERHQSMRVAMLKSQELEQLIYVASHDLRAPLVNLDGFGRELGEAVENLGQVLGTEPEDNQVSLRLRALMPEMGAALTRIRQSTRRMGDLLSGLLSVARLGREELHIRDLDMEALVRRLLRDLEPRFQEAEASLKIGSLPPCRADERQSMQLWLGLLDNAIKFRSPSRQLCLEMGGSRRGNECVYWVADNGIGIAKEHQSKVFELFHKLAPDAAPGEGVGLAMVRQIVARMGGKVWVESKPDIGSRFYVELPASRAGNAA